MLNRILFAIKQKKAHKVELKALLNDPLYAANTVLELDLMKIKASGIDVLVLDFDGVLAAHGKPKPKEDVIAWLNQVVEIFGDHVYILSNKPTEVRLNYFKTHFPKFKFISGVAKKPYPDGMLKVTQLSKVNPSQIALVDDRLLTGALAALIAKCQPIYIKKAWVDYKEKPMVQSFFTILRKVERYLV